MNDGQNLVVGLKSEDIKIKQESNGDGIGGSVRSIFSSGKESVIQVKI